MTKYFDEDKAVARLAEILALKCGIHPITARQIRIAARLHDIGKIKIGASIVNKPGKLNDREFAIMKTHTILGAQMMGSLRGSIGEVITNTCLYHHEFWSGGGYWGKSAQDVPGYVFIVGLCDVYCALTSPRCYKAAWPENAALEYIQSNAGTQFSPAHVEVFTAMIQDTAKITEKGAAPDGKQISTD